MTGKLIKFEFRSIIKQLGAVWAAVPAAAILFYVANYVFHNTDFVRNNMYSVGEMIQNISGILYIGVFAVLIIVTFLIILQRFYKGLLRDEGYLMHTLPVKPWQLITSKGVVALSVVVISSLVAFISIMIIVGIGNITSIFYGIGEIIEACNREPIYYLYLFEGILLLILSILKGIYQMYASMSIGQLFNAHKILFSVLAYIGISVVMTTLLVTVITFLDGVAGSRIMNMLENVEGLLGGQFVMITFLVITALQLVAFHIVSERLLSKKLNLE